MNITEIINKVLTTPNAAFFFKPPIYGKSDSYLFLKPKEIVTIKSLRNLDEKLILIDQLLKRGLAGYALIYYEAGYLFEKKLNKYLPQNTELIRFFFYDHKDIIRITSDNVSFENDEKYQIKNFRLNTNRSEFVSSIRKIRDYIKKGDTYQVNYTVKGKFDFAGSYSSLLSNLVFNQSAQYTSFINDGKNIILSLSPELFFEVKGRKIKSKPMKGTTRRGQNLIEDLKKKNELVNSVKNRAENVMIVDLIRNDLGRISEYGSVSVPSLFEIEKYETVYQMVSTVQSKLKNNIMLSDVLKNIFPCGSITGAPKIRTMEIINELEKESRGLYTGSIGLFINGKMTFNVSIRTLLMDKKSGNGEIGLGSGVVWTSKADEEYAETKLKGKFLTDPINQFKLFESALVENRKIKMLNEHLNRMEKAAEYFLFVFDREAIEQKIINYLKSVDEKRFKLKISLTKTGKIEFIKTPITPVEQIKVIISKNRISTENRFQYFKTTNRLLYEKEYSKYSRLGFFDVLFLNEKNEIAEGSITNIFIKKNRKLLTPPVEAGILPGLYRSKLLSSIKNVFETNLTLNDLLTADEIFLTNAVRGKIKVDLLYSGDKEILRF